MPSRLYQINNKILDLNKITNADYDEPANTLKIYLTNNRTITFEGEDAEEAWRIFQTFAKKPKDPLMPPVPDGHDPEQWITNYGTDEDKRRWELIKSKQRLARSLKERPL